MSAQVYTVPMCPTKNRLYYTKRRVKTQVYRWWESKASAEIAYQRIKANYPRQPFQGPVAVHLDVGYSARRDLGNHWDPVSDVLQLARVVENDKQIQSIRLDWAEGVTGIRIEVRPYDAKQPDTRAA